MGWLNILGQILSHYLLAEFPLLTCLWSHSVGTVLQIKLGIKECVWNNGKSHLVLVVEISIFNVDDGALEISGKIVEVISFTDLVLLDN